MTAAGVLDSPVMAIATRNPRSAVLRARRYVFNLSVEGKDGPALGRHGLSMSHTVRRMLGSMESPNPEPRHGNARPMGASVPTQTILVADHLRQVLGDDLRAVWLYGSFVAGSPQPASDVDLLAVLARRLHDHERAALMADLLAMSSPPGDPERRALELTCVVLPEIRPWRHPAMRELQFGEWLRKDLSGGLIGDRQPDPDLALLLTQARRHGVALHGPDPAGLLPIVPESDIRAAILTMLPAVAVNLAGEEKHALLTLARMWVTLAAGAIVPKDAAVTRVVPLLPPAHRPVLLHARDAYRGTISEDWTPWQPAVAACARYMADTLIRRYR